MGYRLCLKASGYAADASSHRHVLLTVAFVQIEEVHSNRPVTAVGLMLLVRCGSQKLCLQTTFFLSLLMDWIEFHQHVIV